MNVVVILGAGGHTRSLINLLEYNSFKIAGIFDDTYHDLIEELISGYMLKGKIADCPADKKVVLSTGNNYERALLFNKFSSQMLKDNLFHPSSVVEKRVRFGISNQIFANTYINSHAEIGDNNIINTGATIEHEVNIGSNNHVSVNSTICGRVSIGDNCLIGAGAVIIDKIAITNDVIIGANSVVIRDIPEAGVYAGSPARKITRKIR